MDHRISKKKQTPREQQLGYQGAGHVPPSGDADLAAYLSAAGISNETEVNAVTTVFEDLKISGIWDKLIYLFLCSPTSLSAALVNAKTAVSATNNGATHSSSGLATENNNYFHAAEYNFGNLPDFDFHCSLYMDAPNVSSGQGLMGYYAHQSRYYAGLSMASSNTRGAYGDSSVGTALQPLLSYSAPGGFYLFNVETSTSAIHVRNNSTSNTVTGTTGSISGIDSSSFLFGNTRISGGGYFGGATTVIKTATVGRRLTSQQKTDLYDIVLAYNTALGRA